MTVRRLIMLRAALLTAVLTASLSSPAGVRGDERQRRELRRTPVVEAYERVRDSVVNISATEQVVVQRWGKNLFGDLFAIPTEQSARSVGSGFVIHEDGYVATNAHVASAGAQLTVTLADGTAFDARIIGRDTTRDLAVLEIDPAGRLVPIPFGRSDDLMIGERTIAIGNPVGLHNTVTTGVISALHRNLEVGGRVFYSDVIQTDASINPGNSGGPLVNVLGELIGVNTAIRTDAQNIGFAIPVDQLREMLPEILDSEKLNKVQVGMKVSGEDTPMVARVREGSPADRAGVRPGDILTAIDGRRIKRGVDYYVAMLNRTAGDVVTLSLLRDGRVTDTRLTLAAVPKPDGKRLALARLGLVISDAKDKTAKHFRWDRRPSGRGVIVVAVEPGSPANRADIQPGDLLVSMGPHWLTDVNHVGTLLDIADPGDLVDVGFRRERRGRLYDGEVHLHAR